MYAQETALTRRIVENLEEDPSWELVALCTTLADLNFVLDRVTVDVVFLQLTPATGGLVLVERKLQSMPREEEGGFWAFLSPMPESHPACRTARDIMGTDAYRRFDGAELTDHYGRCNTVA
jgi:hypothetical protein